MIENTLNEKKRVIIDCDPGIDDAMALLLAIASPNIDIVGITIVGGNTKASKCGMNALRVLKIGGRLDIPVYLGESKPLVRKLEVAEETHGKDGLGGASYIEVDSSLLREGALEFLVENGRIGDIHLVTLGPMTNIAKAMIVDLEAINGFLSITSMGGTHKVRGNCSPVAEFNYWVDPHGADYVYSNYSSKVDMIGLHITNRCLLTPSMRELLWQMNTPTSRFIHEITRTYVDYYWNLGIHGSLVHDALAMAYFIDPSLCKGYDTYIDIITDGKAMGMSMVDEANFYNKKPNTHLLTEVDVDRFFRMFFSSLFPDQLASILEVI